MRGMIMATVLALPLACLADDAPADKYHKRPPIVCMSAPSLRIVLSGSVRQMHKAYDGAFYDEGSVPMEFWLSDTGRWALVAAWDSQHYCIHAIGVQWAERKSGGIDDGSVE